MRYKYILYNDHYGTGIIDEAIKDKKHILWSAIPVNDSYKAYECLLVPDDDEWNNEFEQNDKIAQQIFRENYSRLGRPRFMYVAFYNLDYDDIFVYTNRDEMNDMDEELDFFILHP